MYIVKAPTGLNSVLSDYITYLSPLRASQIERIYL